jgi:hypothetical protein
MIFNKANNGNTELRTLTGSYYKSNDFDKISVKIMLASEDLQELIGKEIFQRAENHYLSADYLAATDPALNDQLVQHIQLPISFLATLWHYQGNDISHEDSGRKMKIDPESEKMAWEWMYDRDDAAALRNYQKAFDRLVKFLNANAADLEEWKDSTARKKTLALFIPTYEAFNDLFSIDSSPVFFLRIAPIMREVERKFIKPIIGAEKFTELKELIASGEEIFEDVQELIETICTPIPLLTMAIAVKRFSLSLIPEGVVQNFISERHTAKASYPATLDIVNAVAKSLHTDGLNLLNELKKYWSTINTDESDQSITNMLPTMDPTDKFISL